MLTKILKNNICAGCGLCQSVYGFDKISLKLNDEGFYRPFEKQRLNKDENKLLSEFCPALIVKKNKTDSPKKDVIWGEMFSCFVGSSSDKEIRKEASSGGGISALLNYLITNRKVDAIIHIGASKKIPYLNEVKISTTREEILENANSRYAPSAPLQYILESIKQYDSYAFVGKPCDIAALRQYSLHNSEVRNKIKYYISFFCAGVPSLNATTDIIGAMDLKNEDVASVSYRKDGWPGYFKITDKNNRIYKLSYSLTWMKLLGPRVQFRCKICADGIGHLADVVCADAWEDFDKSGFPTFKDAPGKSLIISRTETGEKLVQEALQHNELTFYNEISNYREIDKMQPGQFSKKVYFLPRYLGLIFKNKTVPKFNSEFYFKATFKSNPISFVRNLIGIMRRV